MNFMNREAGPIPTALALAAFALLIFVVGGAS